MCKRIIAIFISATIMMLSATISFAKTSDSDVALTLSDKYSLNIVDASEALLIEELVEKNNTLRSTLKDVSIEARESANVAVQSEINANNQKIQSLGGKSPSNELLADLIETAIEQSGVQPRANFHPSDLIEDYNEMYDMSASYATTYNGKTQYHLLFQYRGYDSYLKKVSMKLFYNGITAGSAEARNWGNEIIKIYAEKFTSYGLGAVDTLLTLIPYELLGIALQPEYTTISAPANATSVLLNTTSIQKFVYVYNDSISDWFYALSTNKVSYSVSVTQALTINGRSYNETTDYNNLMEYGDYNKASMDANNAYNMYSSQNTCINKVAGYSDAKSRDMVVNTIYTPMYVVDML